MNDAQTKRGGAPVGYIAELDAIEAASVIYLRLWADGPVSRAQVKSDFATALGVDQGNRAVRTFEQLCSLCASHGRRPLMHHSVQCKCLGADESCFANFIAAAAGGEREDAMLFASLLVRVDVAPMIVSCAADFGLALKRMRLAAPVDLVPMNIHPTTLH